MNDIVGMAQSVIYKENMLNPQECFIRLTPPTPVEYKVNSNAPQLIFAMGTGLGVANIVHTGKRFIVLPSEGWAAMLSAD